MQNPRKNFIDAYKGHMVHAKRSYSHRVAVGIPMTGLVRAEWMFARYGQVIPCNWSQVEIIRTLDTFSPIGYMVADGRNLIASAAVEGGFEWLWFIDHDVVLPPITILKWNDRMLKKDVPVWGGLYFTKSVPSEPLVYRGRGNSYYKDWKLGDKVWVDGMGMGNTVIHSSILKVLYDESESYQLGDRKVRRIFETPAKVYLDPETMTWATFSGTEDLYWYSRVMDDDIFSKAGWPKYAKKKWPFLLDTSVFSKHISQDGNQYPLYGEERRWIPNMKKINQKRKKQMTSHTNVPKHFASSSTMK